MPANDIFGPGSNTARRVLRDYAVLAKMVEACKKIGLKIVLTSGSFDLLHHGHSRYLEQAKEHGDILIVGVDSDKKIKARKGPERPIVPEEERVEVLCHLRHVDLVMIKELDDPKQYLIKTVNPDVLILTQETYNETEIEQIKPYCGEIIVLEPQATVSTSARLRMVIMQAFNGIRVKLHEVLGLMDEMAGKSS